MNQLIRRGLKHRKAISPILATLLLIVIAVAAIVVTYAWIMTYMTHTIGQASAVPYLANVNFYGNGTKIDIDIGNSGTSDTAIIQLYIGLAQSSEQNVTITSTPIPAGTVQRLTVDYSWQSQKMYYFKAIASTGQPLPWTYSSP